MLQGHVYFTICSINYLPYARVLAESLRQSTNVRFVCFLVDEVRGRISVDHLGIECIEIKSIGCPFVYDMAARYDVMEMNTAIKPFCFAYLMRQTDVRSVVYLDPDIFVTSPLDELTDSLERGASIVLTPHSLSPLVDGGDPDDIRLMRTGTFNLGFCAVSNDSVARDFIEWWSQHLIQDCVVDLARGVFVDQKFCDLVPCYFDNVHVLRHPGYNVAYWNLTHRFLSKEARGTWNVNGEKLRFFHFSGVIPGDRNVFSKHQNRFTAADLGVGRDLLNSYLDALEQNALLDDIRLSEQTYFYSRFTNGETIPDPLRKVYGRVFSPKPRTYTEAFDADRWPTLWLSPDVPAFRECPVTRLMFEIWSSRDDLKAHFHLGDRNGQIAFLDWFSNSATREHKVPASIVVATRGLTRSEPVATPHNIGLVVESTTALSRSPLERIGRWASMRTITGKSISAGMIGYFHAENGLGSAVRANHAACRSVDIDVKSLSIPCAGFQEDVSFATSRPDELNRCDIVISHVNADQSHTVWQWADPTIALGSYLINYWAWELSTFPLQWVQAVNAADEIWAPSRFTAEAIASRTSKPVIVIPHPVVAHPPGRPIAELRRSFGLPNYEFIFLAALDLNSYIHRKNPEAVVRCFSNAFGLGPNGPRLVMKVHGRGRRGSSWSRLREQIAANPRIILIDRVLTSQEVSDLQWASDAFVSLHRSEGFGLWLAECMARGKPCIATAYSGNVDFMNDDNSIPIGFTMKQVQAGEYPFGDGQWWAEPDSNMAVDALRLLASDEALATRVGASAGEHLESRLSYSAVGGQIRRRLFRARAEAIDIPPVLISASESQPRMS